MWALFQTWALFFQLDDDLEDYYDYDDYDTTEAPIQITSADEITCIPSNRVTTTEVPISKPIQITTTEVPIQKQITFENPAAPIIETTKSADLQEGTPLWKTIGNAIVYLSVSILTVVICFCTCKWKCGSGNSGSPTGFENPCYRGPPC